MEVTPKDFVSWDVLKLHLPVFLCGAEHTEESLDNLANFIAKDLIIKYAQELQNETK